MHRSPTDSRVQTNPHASSLASWHTQNGKALKRKGYLIKIKYCHDSKTAHIAKFLNTPQSNCFQTLCEKSQPLVEKERKTQHTQGNSISESKPQSHPSTETTSVIGPVSCCLASPTYSPSTEQCVFVHVCICVDVCVFCMQEYSHVYSGVPEKTSPALSPSILLR